VDPSVYIETIAGLNFHSICRIRAVALNEDANSSEPDPLSTSNQLVSFDSVRTAALVVFWEAASTIVQIL